VSVEFIGMLGTSGFSESRLARGPAIDKTYLAAIAQAHEYAGFDRVLIGYFSVERLLAAAAQGKVVDKRLWTEIAGLTGAKGNSTSLVGTPEQVGLPLTVVEVWQRRTHPKKVDIASAVWRGWPGSGQSMHR
jgi:hypothetical protein